MAIRYFRSKTGRMLASLPNGEMIDGDLFPDAKNNFWLLIILILVSNSKCKMVTDDSTSSFSSLNQYGALTSKYLSNIMIFY